MHWLIPCCSKKKKKKEKDKKLLQPNLNKLKLVALTFETFSHKGATSGKNESNPCTYYIFLLNRNIYFS